jgi:hypothetical protein
MVTHQGCPQTPGGRLRALGFASTRTQGRNRGPRTGDVSWLRLAGMIPVRSIQFDNRAHSLAPAGLTLSMAA